jgi:hypothetical protein
MYWRSVSAAFVLNLLPIIATTARAHDWYPMECCHGMDCAPVDRIDVGGSPGGIIVTSRVGTAVIPPEMTRRESQDNRMHVCMRKTPTGAMRVLCVFVPPST